MGVEPASSRVASGSDDARLRLQQAVLEYHAANARAAASPLGTPEYDEAIADVRRLWKELEAGGINPVESWRDPVRRKLDLPTKHPYPARHDGD